MEKPIVQKLADLEESAFLDLIRQQLEPDADSMTILQGCREGMVLEGKRSEENT